ncbi:HCNGP-like protein-domain-containing protein [Xylaria bambusicola]|uniref:HCNGP-like protein-domain-containing protein n=1 Tax=Xylaria bambusicola TaxID=326684 RepID=UPI0020086D51|nr:HCNGP-like protein-domain-containing protein [Xylaria bambusicola]KAI0516803.1 HCNGP-like protein-domain-containing protein [Xylaria bambusicola]
MAGLVAYESSDEEEEVKPQPAQPAPEPLRRTEADTADTDSIQDTTTKETLKGSQPDIKLDEKHSIYGPQLGPTSGPSFPPLEEDPTAVELQLPPGSPYTATRALLRDLTLPTVPDMDIPPSPPGSPSAVTSKKFENFLELKKKGVHFNSRLADNTSMKNPALADKLLAFVELDNRDQYRTTLPVDLWDPDMFPRHAYKEQLRQSQSESAQAKARPTGAPVKFVPSETSTKDSKTPQPPSTGTRKTRFDA